MKKLLLIAFTILTISGCATKHIEPDVYSEQEALTMRSVSKGVILEVMPVMIKGEKVIGTASGAVVGGIAGSAIGGNDRVKVIGGTLGALIGSGVGRVIDGWITTEGGYQYIIKLRRNGEIIAIVQGGDIPLEKGDNVLMLHNNNQTKVIKNTTAE